MGSAKREKEQSRVVWVEYAKGIGIVLVVFGHVQRGLFNAEIIQDISLYEFFDDWIYSFHMPLFFFLSGIFFYSDWQKRGHKKFLIGKMDAIFYPYILWSLLQGGIEASLSSQTNGQVSWIQVISLWQPRAQFWFLYALFLIFIFNSFLAKYFRERWLMISMILAIASFELSNLVHIQGITGAMKNIIFFNFGALLSYYLLGDKVRKNAKVKGGLGILLLIGCFLLVNYDFNGDVLISDISIIFLSCMGIAGVVLVSFFLSVISKIKWLSIVGKYSLHIYLIHVIAASGGRILLQKVGYIESYWIHVTSGMLLGVLVPILMAVILERLGWQVFFHPPVWLSFKTRRIG